METLPRNLPTALGPPPRQVRAAGFLAAGGLWVGRLFILPHMLVGIGAAFFCFWMALWLVAGTNVPAHVLRGHTGVQKGNLIYTLDFEYLEDGRMYRGSGDVDAATYQRYMPDLGAKPVKTPLPARFLKVGRLNRLAPTGRESDAAVLFSFVFAAFWNGVMSIIIWRLWVVPIRTRRLYKWGEATVGTLLEKDQKKGKTMLFYVSYEFKDSAGQTHRQKMQVNGIKIWQEANVGQPVTVLYDPAKPERSVAYEFGLYHVIPATDADAPDRKNPYAA